MGIIYLGTIIILLSSILVYNLLGFVYLFIFVVFGTCITGILSVLPLEGYCIAKERITNIIELDRNASGNIKYYLEIKGKSVIYAIDNRAKYSLDGIAYEEVSLKGKIKIYESKDCKKPILKKYVSEPIRSNLTISKLFTKIEYVFYIPKGTLLEHGKENLNKNKLLSK